MIDIIGVDERNLMDYQKLVEMMKIE